MFPESDLLPLSALQHLLYCPRQCALIHLEQQWAENSLTIQGRHLHERADSGKSERRPKVSRRMAQISGVEVPADASGALAVAVGASVRTVRSLALRSLNWGLIGKADVVEFHHQPSDQAGHLTGAVRCFPVEYKRGKPKGHEADRVQLCAQALCLEEMLGQPVVAGALFYGKTRRRLDVPFDAVLRELTAQTIQQLHAMIVSRRTPPAIYEKAKCERCSLISLCMPKAAARSGSAAGYMDRALQGVLTSAGAKAD